MIGRARGWVLVIASLMSDAMIVATTLLRVDASDTPSYVVYDCLITHRFFVPPWLVQIVAVPGTGGYDFLLYVPVVATWALCLGLAWRETRLRAA